MPNALRAVELVFQQRAAHQWTEAEASLFDVQFLLAKVAAGMVLDLDDDYRALLQEASENSLPRSKALRLIPGALRLSTHVVAQDRTQFASQLVGRLLAHQAKPDVASFVDEITTAALRPWLRPLEPDLEPPGTPLVRILVRWEIPRLCRGILTPPGAASLSNLTFDKTLYVTC